MTKDQFHGIKVGDKIQFNGSIHTVASIQTEYDYSEIPAKVNTWAFETKQGGYCKIQDKEVPYLTLVN